MTFDDIIDILHDISEDSVEDRLDITMWLIGELRETYAPTIEMTRAEKEALIHAKQHLMFTQFIEGVHGNSMHSMYMLTIETAFKNRLINNLIDEDELMTAWLHPELIKVVD